MCLDWKNEKNWKSFISGGVENNDLIQSAINEIREETGYVNVKFVKEIDCETRDRFYAPHKDINRYLINHAVVFDLIDEEMVELDPLELKKHKPVWVNEEDVLDFLNIENNKFIFRKYLGEEQEYDRLSVLVKDILKINLKLLKIVLCVIYICKLKGLKKDLMSYNKFTEIAI